MYKLMYTFDQNGTFSDTNLLVKGQPRPLKVPAYFWGAMNRQSCSHISADLAYFQSIIRHIKECVRSRPFNCIEKQKYSHIQHIEALIKTQVLW